MGKFVTYVGMEWRLQWTVSSSLPAMNVPSLCAGLATNMREGKEIRCVLSVKPDTSASKVTLCILQCGDSMAQPLSFVNYL